MTETVKAAKAKVHTTFEELEDQDPCVKGASMKIDEDKKADAPRSVNEAI